MPDKFSKSHPWRATLNRDVTITVGALVIEEPRTGAQSVIAPPYEMPMPAGERMFRRKSEAIAFVAAHRRDSGADTVTDVYRAT